MPRQFVPQDLDCNDWQQIEPLFQQLLEHDLDSEKAVQDWLAHASELTAVLSEFGSRRNIDHACHTDDEEVEKAYLHWVEQISPKIQPYSFEMKKKLLASEHVGSLDQQTYGVMLRQWQSEVDLYREENIALDVEVTKLNAQYDKTIGAMLVEYDGKKQTLQQLARYQEEPDRSVREKTWNLSANRRLEDHKQIDNIFQDMLFRRERMAKNADCKNYRDYVFKDMCRFDYTPDDCLAFGNAVEAAVRPVKDKLYDARAKAMGLKQLRPWDTTVDPLGRSPLHPFPADSVDQLVTGTREIFHRISPQLADMFARLKMQRNLDLESRKGKRAGGFQSSLLESGEPFIFMNAAGLQRDVETLLHEGGHAFHFLWAYEKQPVVFLAHAPLEFCEVASMSMELLAMDHFDVFYTDDEQVQRAKRRLLTDVIHTLAWIATIDGFQHWIYTHPSHTEEDRTYAWLNLLDRFQGDRVDYTGLEEARAALWQRQLHLFHVPFYYIEYGIAQLGALQLWMNYRNDSAKTLEQYKAALSLGDTRPLPELFEAAGIKFDFSETTLNPLIAAVERELSALPV